MLTKRLEKTTSPTDGMSKIDISDTIIYRPRTNCTYHLRNADYDTEIIFNGSAMKHCQYFDISSGNFKVDSKPDTLTLNFKGSLFLVSDKSFSFENKTICSLPIIYKTKNSQFIIPEKIYIDINKNAENDISGSINYEGDETKAYVAENQSILRMIQNFLPDMKVEVGKFPLFMQKKRPSYDFLEKKYKEFIQYNDKRKLNYQYNKLSSGKCHVRAHFVNRWLEREGIQSFKIYKFWDNPVSAWVGHGCKFWTFHCATMVLDQNGNAWVWDPWVGDNSKLLTINEWMYAADEPIPNSAFITGSFNIVNPDHKTEYYYPHFMTDAVREDIKIFQDISANAEPESTKFPLKNSLVAEDQIRMMEQMDIALEHPPENKLPGQKITDVLIEQKVQDKSMTKTSDVLTKQFDLSSEKESADILSEQKKQDKIHTKKLDIVPQHNSEYKSHAEKAKDVSPTLKSSSLIVSGSGKKRKIDECKLPADKLNVSTFMGSIFKRKKPLPESDSTIERTATFTF